MSSRTIIVTGGAGFIGSHVVRRLVTRYPDYHIICLDKLTYAGNLANLTDLHAHFDSSFDTAHLPFNGEKVNDIQKNNNDCRNLSFVRMDICDTTAVNELIVNENVDGIIHLAAESHVDRSIEDPLAFARTNVIGTLSLLEAARQAWLKTGFEGKRFYHISTDEVFGALELVDNKKFSENSPYAPHSPYSASKASADHFVRAFADTYRLPVVISNCSNNYGPNQFPEKLIPLVINNILHKKDIPVYGKGENVRDWLYVEDHAEAIDEIFHKGTNGSTYCIGGGNEISNIDLVRKVIKVTDKVLGLDNGEDEGLIKFVKDRPGHDMRYAIDATRLAREIGWRAKTGFEEGLEKTVRWYLANEEWLRGVTSGEYLKYYDKMYSGR